MYPTTKEIKKNCLSTTSTITECGVNKSECGNNEHLKNTLRTLKETGYDDRRISVYYTVIHLEPKS